MADVRDPVLVAFDGSATAGAALTAAARLFAGHRRLLIVSVWEPGVAQVMMTMPEAVGPSYQLPDPELVATVDHLRSDHATALAEAGVALARDQGCEAEPLPVVDESDIAETLCALAEQRHAAAIVVGSRGLSGLRARLEGSTSKSLLKHAPCPVLVVHEPGKQDG